MKTISTLILVIAQSYFCFSQSKIDSLYLGKTFPGNKPVVFLAGITERIAISSDGKDIFFNSLSGLSYCHYSNNAWGSPQALFTGFGEASLSINDSILYVQNSQPNSYYSLKSASGWSDPVKLWSNSANKHHLQVTNSGAFYTTTSPKISSRGDIAKVIINGSDVTLKSLPSPVNSTLNGVDFYIAKDESYIIFPEIVGGAGDLYISYKKTDTTWTNPKSLGSLINTTDWEFGPYVSPDNKYLFFSRSTASATYWVKLGNMIDSLKMIAIPAGLNNDYKPIPYKIFPNPTTGHITLSLGTSQNNESLVEIYNLQGTKVFSKTFQNTTSATIDLTGHPAGIYLVKVIADGVSYEEKIVKE